MNLYVFVSVAIVIIAAIVFVGYVVYVRVLMCELNVRNEIQSANREVSAELVCTKEVK